ncbi:hypothetical protein DV738_g5587, partial [Chaetothyriales sp. CBS 135597]
MFTKKKKLKAEGLKGVVSTLLDLDEIEYEQALQNALRQARAIARTEVLAVDVLIAKLAVLAIRQLHASDVFPRTAIRAMVLMEFDQENRSTGGAIIRAKREIREEDRARRAAAGVAVGGGPGGMGGLPASHRPPLYVYVYTPDIKSRDATVIAEKLPNATYTWTTTLIPPPGIDALAPNGFPTPPFPPAAAQPPPPAAFIDAMIVRVRVFVDEQKCSAEAELDEDDPRSWHWVLKKDKKKIPVSVIRIVPPPHGPHPNGHADAEEKPYVKLGRVATMKEWRRQGLSRRLVEEAFGWLCKNRHDIGPGWEGDVLCHAQVDVEKMYERLGFRTDERLGRWVEEGIEHLAMWRRIEIEDE